MSSETAEANAPNAEHAQRISGLVELSDVRTIEFAALLQGEAPAAVDSAQGALAVTLTINSEPTQFQVLGNFRVKVHEPSKSVKEAFLTAHFSVVAYYGVPEGFSATEEELRSFAQLSSMIHLWPYFRAFVQQACGQLSIPSIVIPVFRANRPMKVRFGAWKGMRTQA